MYGQPDGSYSAYLGYFPSTLPQLKFPGYLDNLYCSMVVGEDGCLYLSYFTGSASDFYRLTFNEETKVYECRQGCLAGYPVRCRAQCFHSRHKQPTSALDAR